MVSAERTTALMGMKDICTYTGRSESTILQLVARYPDSIPVRKVLGQWCSDRLQWDAWWRRVVSGEVADITA